jgi:HK97 family phage portal protein
VNKIQKFLLKAIGFPPWRGSTTDIPPGGWGSWDSYTTTVSPVDLATVYACCRVLCQTLGSVPFHVYKEDQKTGVREKFVDHPLYRVLHDSPNAYMTSMEFREALVMGLCLRGNGYAEKVMLGDRVVGLNPLRADLVYPKMEPGKPLVYEYAALDGHPRTFRPDEIVPVKNFSLDGINGLSPIRQHVIQHAQYTERYAMSFMRNQGRPSGVLESKKAKPKDPEYNNRLSEDWKKLYGGENAGGTAVLWDEMTYKQISISPDDAQYIETRKLNAADIAGIFGVPENMLAHTDKTATYASAEQFDIQFTKHTIRPLAVRFEQAFNKSLFALEPGVYCEMDLDALMRGDAKSQGEYFGAMVDHGILTSDEVRRKTNFPEVGGLAAKLRCQSNMIPLEDLGKLALAAQATPGQSVGDIRKDTEPSETGFQMHVQKMEQTVLAPKPMKKTGKAKRLADGTITFEIEENHNGA